MSDKISEEKLCEWFISQAEKNGWECYPETSGWDILLARDGIQIGVQAKLRANLKVVDQCLPRRLRGTSMIHRPERFRGYGTGPNYRVALIPQEGVGKETIKSLRNVCRALGIWMISMGKNREDGIRLTDSGLGIIDDPGLYPAYDWKPTSSCWTPDVVPTLPAGVAAPRSLTKWKQQALRLIARAQTRGYVTSKDAKELKINFSFFTTGPKPWMKFAGKEGRVHKYELDGEDPKRPDINMPEEYAHFLSEAEIQEGESGETSE